jgi:transcription elongation factor Elf1
MSCPKCAKHRLINIAVTIADQRVTMHSCSHCGERWWDREGQRVALPAVLDLASSNR